MKWSDRPSDCCRRGPCLPEGWTPGGEGCPHRWRGEISPPPGHCWALAHFHRRCRCGAPPAVSEPPPRRCASRRRPATRGRRGGSCQVRAVQAAVPSCHPAPSEGSEGLSWGRELRGEGNEGGNRSGVTVRILKIIGTFTCGSSFMDKKDVTHVQLSKVWGVFDAMPPHFSAAVCACRFESLHSASYFPKKKSLKNPEARLTTFTAAQKIFPEALILQLLHDL